MRCTIFSVALATIGLSCLAGCTTYVDTNSPPPRVEIESKPAPAKVDVDVKTGEGGGVKVDVDRK
jgi:hypothetical protein